MEPFEIVFKRSSERDMKGLSNAVVGRVLVRIEALAGDPTPRGSLKLEGSESLHRIRIGEYRVIYGIDFGSRRVTIHHVRHRRDAYRDL